MASTINLISYIASDGQSAFRELYNLHCDRVFNTAISYVQDKKEAEEIAQDVFIQVLNTCFQL